MCFGIGKNLVRCDCAATIPNRIPEGSTCFQQYQEGEFPDEGCLCLRNRIPAAVALVDRVMLTSVCNEMDYRIDVCRITVLSVKYVKKKLGEFLSLSA